jgi:O-antigen ligase
MRRRSTPYQPLNMSKYFISNLSFTTIVSFAVFFFYAINQPISSGYSYGSGLLLLSSLLLLVHRPWRGLGAQDKSFIWLFLALFCIGALTCIVNGDSLRDLDISSRFLLAIPIFLLLLKFPPRLRWLWAGVAVGGYSTAGVAIWQLYGLGWTDVDGLSNGVRYGAISTMLGILCIAGLLWTRRGTVTHVWAWRAALGLGALSAWYGSLMSGTRGAWIALPIVFILFCLGTFSKHKLREGAALCAVVIVVMSTWIAATPTNPIKAGYNNAVNDIDDYFQRGIVTGSIGGRFAVWDAAFINIPTKPMLGWGVREYREQLERQVADHTLDPYVLELAHTHNMYLETLVYKGVVGLLAILALFIVPFFYFYRRLRSANTDVRILAICGTSLLAVFAILGLSHISLYRNDILLFFLVTLMTLWGCMRAQESSGSPSA